MLAGKRRPLSRQFIPVAPHDAIHPTSDDTSLHRDGHSAGIKVRAIERVVETGDDGGPFVRSGQQVRRGCGSGGQPIEDCRSGRRHCVSLEDRRCSFMSGEPVGKTPVKRTPPYLSKGGCTKRGARSYDRETRRPMTSDAIDRPGARRISPMLWGCYRR